jgi:hypothetical protein
MTAIVEGFYKQGKIDLLEPLPELPEGHVRVIVIATAQPKPPSCLLTFGKYQKGRMSTLEDFKDAEWHGDEEFDAPHGQ